MSIGFKAATREKEISFFKKKRNGTQIVEGEEGYVILHITLIVGLIARQNYWKPRAFVLNTYMARVAANAHLKFGDGGFIFRLPFLVSGNYINQASFLGNPFFYHHNPEKICNSNEVSRKKNCVNVNGQQ
jgi:hypothetical protein